MNDTKACAHTFIRPGHNQLLKCQTKKVIGYTIITSTKVVNSFYIWYAARIQYITYFTVCLVSIISTITCYVKILWSITEIQFPTSITVPDFSYVHGSIHQSMFNIYQNPFINTRNTDSKNIFNRNTSQKHFQ